MALNEQLEVASQRIVELPRFSFFVRPATAEGSVSQSVSKITLSKVTDDPETNAPVFPDETLIQRLKSRLVKRSGIPVADILAEQEARLKPPVVAPATSDLAPVPLRREGAAQLPPGKATADVGQETRQRPPRKATPPPPVNATVQLADKERAFLTFLIGHPDTPISSVYKGLQVSVWKGNEIRDSLKAKGLLAEVEFRTVRTTAGRPAKVVLPTFHAFTLFGIAPPNGRGGVLHRHVQAVIQESATVKGYTVKCEKVLENGAIVDVHLENAQKIIAVEIAVLSTPEREIRHIRNCLAVGYDQVFTIFADEKLLERTAQLLGESLSEDVAGKVRLLPLSQLPHVG